MSTYVSCIELEDRWRVSVVYLWWLRCLYLFFSSSRSCSNARKLPAVVSLNCQLLDGKNGFVTSFLKRKNEQGQGQIVMVEVDWQYTLFLCHRSLSRSFTEELSLAMHICNIFLLSLYNLPANNHTHLTVLLVLWAAISALLRRMGGSREGEWSRRVFQDKHMHSLLNRSRWDTSSISGISAES